MNPFMLDGELQLAPGFLTPPSFDYTGYHSYIDENMPAESPYLYGLHPNAEIDFLTTKSEYLFRIVLELQPREVSSGSEFDGVQTKEEIVITSFSFKDNTGILSLLKRERERDFPIVSDRPTFLSTNVSERFKTRKA